MKKQTQRKPTRGKFSLLRQLCNLIPNHLVPQLARTHAVQGKCRTFLPWSHVVSLIYAQLTHALSLNDVCDALHYLSYSLNSRTTGLWVADIIFTLTICAVTGGNLNSGLKSSMGIFFQSSGCP